MGTQIKLHPDVETAIVHCNGLNETQSLDCEAIYEQHGILVIDDISWHADFDVLRRFRFLQVKKEEDPQLKISPVPDELARQRSMLQQQASQIYEVLFPRYKYEKRLDREPGLRPDGRMANSWRLMETGSEALHLDSFVSHGLTCLLGFINLDTLPRVWSISHTLPALIERDRDAIEELWLTAQERSAKRQRSTKGPMSVERVFNILLREAFGGHDILRDRPERVSYKRLHDPACHRIEFAPGAFWVLNPKMVTHKIEFGRNAYLHSLHSPKGNPSFLQTNILADAYGEIAA